MEISEKYRYRLNFERNSENLLKNMEIFYETLKYAYLLNVLSIQQ